MNAIQALGFFFLRENIIENERQFPSTNCTSLSRRVGNKHFFDENN